MSQVDVLFQIFVSVAAISLLALACGTLLLRLLKQPIERIRCIQWTLGALLLALVIRHASILPTWKLEILPSLGAASPETPLPNSTGDIEPAVTLAKNSTSNDSRLPVAFTDATIGNSVEPISWTESEFDSQNTDKSEAVFSGAMATIKVVCMTVAGLGAAWFLVLSVAGWLRLRKLLSSCEPVAEKCLSAWQEHSEAESRGTRIGVSEFTKVPLTFGVLRPVIVLPRSIVESEDQSKINYCLSHEWAHAKSRDIATWWFIHLLEPALWFQPLFWYLRRELRTAQDQLADDYATQQTVDRSEYASLLLSFAKERFAFSGNVALTMADRRSTLYRRIEMLCEGRLELARASRRSILMGTIFCFAALCLCVGVLRLGQAQASPVAVEETSEDKPNEERPKQQEEAVSDEKSEELHYSGTVYDKTTDKPIEGAKVVIRRMILKSYDRRVIEESEHTTDAEGNYEFTIPPEQTAERSLYIELDVEHPDYAWKKGFGYALGMIRKNERLGEQPFFAEIKLSPSEPITGRVVDPEGNPLSGVYIQSYSKTSTDDFRDYGSFFKAKTGTDGNFRLQMVKGGPSVFWVVPENHAPIQIVSGTKRGDWGDVTVPKGVSIKGQVLSATGEPVAGVWVNLEDTESQQEIQMPVATSIRRSEMSDENGKFSLSPMKPGKYSINVSGWPGEIKHHEKPGRRKQIDVDHVFVSEQIEIREADADRPFIVQAKPHVMFHGQYMNSKGEPRSGHRVMIFGQLDGSWFHTNLAPDANGKIVGKLPHGLTGARMDAITNEHGAIQVRLEKDGPLAGGRQLSLGTIEDDLTGIEIIRYTAPIVQVKPVDEDGNIVEDVKVAGVYSDGKTETMQPVGGMATNVFFEQQKDGRHRTSQMIPDRNTKFTVTKEGYEEASAELALPEGQEKEVVLVLKKSSKSKPGES